MMPRERTTTKNMAIPIKDRKDVIKLNAFETLLLRLTGARRLGSIAPTRAYNSETPQQIGTLEAVGKG